MSKPKRGIRLLVWCPLVNPGGGMRLLQRLVQVIKADPRIEKLELAVPQAAIQHFVGPIANLEVHSLTPPPSLMEKLEKKFPSKRRLWQKLLLRIGHAVSRRIVPSQSEKALSILHRLAEGMDVIYAFWPHRQEFPAVGVPVVCTFQDAIFFDFPEILGGERTAQELARARKWLEQSTKVVVSSNATKDAIERHFFIDAKEFRKVHHAILTEQLDGNTAATSQGKWRKEFGDYIVFPANIMPHKNHYNLLLAWSRFSMREKYKLVLFGTGTEKLRVKAPEFPDSIWAARLIGLTRSIDLHQGSDYIALGYIPDNEVLGLIQESSGLIMPTMAEGGGSYPIEEALTLGIPVLCSAIPVIKEHLSGRTARIGWFDPYSPDSITAALETFHTEYNDYKNSALAGMHDKRPTWEDVAAQYVDVFEEALHQRLNR